MGPGSRRIAGLLAGLVAALFSQQAAAQVNARPDTRSGKEVVDTVCSACHATGKNGAPHIGNRDEWIPRMKRGLDALTAAAIKGHNGMPARGGQANLTDVEVHNAIAYMFNPVVQARAPVAAASAGPPVGTRRTVVRGVRFDLGLASADQMRTYPPGSTEATMHGGVPSGSGYHHINVSLADVEKGAAIAGAQVEVEVSQAASGTRKIVLEPMDLGGSASYGNYVRLASTAPAVYTVRIRRPGSSTWVEARFTPQAD